MSMYFVLRHIILVSICYIEVYFDLKIRGIMLQEQLIDVARLLVERTPHLMT